LGVGGIGRESFRSLVDEITTQNEIRDQGRSSNTLERAVVLRREGKKSGQGTVLVGNARRGAQQYMQKKGVKI